MGEDFFVIDTNATIEYVDLDPLHTIDPKFVNFVNEPATFTCDNVTINPDLFEFMLGPYYFLDYALHWAVKCRKDLIHRVRYSKKKRIRRKYLKRIYNGYREHLKG